MTTTTASNHKDRRAEAAGWVASRLRFEHLLRSLESGPVAEHRTPDTR